MTKRFKRFIKVSGSLFTGALKISLKYFFRFRVFFFLNLILVPFSLPGSLGVGSCKQTQKPLGAHQERISIAMKEDTAVFVLQTKLGQPFLVSCIGKIWKHETLTSIASFTLYHSYNLLLSALLKEPRRVYPRTGELISERKTKKFLWWRTASTSIKLGKTMIKRPPVLDSAWYARTPGIGQR